MKALPPQELADQLAPSAARDQAHGLARQAHARADHFRDALGLALARTPPATHSAQAAQVGGDKAKSPREPSAPRDAAEAALEEQGGQAATDGAEASDQPGSSSSRRPGVHKRLDGHGHGQDPAAQGPNASSSAGPAAAAAGGHAAVAAPARAKATLTSDGAARISSTLAGKQLATPSQGKPNPASASASERGKTREREVSRAPESAPAAARLDPPHPPASQQDAPATARPAAARPASPLPPPPPGQDVHGALLRNAAHLKVDGGALGPIELHLRLREGALHLRVDGDAARVVEARAGELSRTLAGDGLRLAIEPPSRDGTALGSGGEGGRQGQERREAWDEAADTRGHTPPATPATKSTRTVTPGGVHVTA